MEPALGPLPVGGAGGPRTDLMADRVVRVPPTTYQSAVEQLSELRCAPIFGGFRNLPALDLDATVEVILALSTLARELPEIRELDINPLLIGRIGVSGLDVRIRIGTGDGEHAVRSLKGPFASGGRIG